MVDDESGCGLFGVFLPLYQKMKNINELTFRTEERNIIVILEECLPYMEKLDKLNLITNSRGNDRLRTRIIETIRRLKPRVILTMSDF
jgi:hypothetical protein